MPIINRISRFFLKTFRWTIKSNSTQFREKKRWAALVSAFLQSSQEVEFALEERILFVQNLPLANGDIYSKKRPTRPLTSSPPNSPFSHPIKHFALVPRVVQNLVKSHGEVRGGRFVAAFEHPVRQVLERKTLFLLAWNLDGPVFGRALFLGSLLDRDAFSRGGGFGGNSVLLHSFRRYKNGRRNRPPKWCSQWQRTAIMFLPGLSFPESSTSHSNR